LSDLTELAKLRTLVTKASLAAEARHSALWCLDQLPKLYAEFRRTDESRFYDAIGKLAGAVLKRLAEAGAGDAAAKVCEAVVRRLGEMHRRLGIAPLALPTAAAPRPGRRRKVG
jgi:hypothetical protein